MAADKNTTMNELHVYIELIEKFLARQITAEEFQKAYLDDRFAEIPMTGEYFGILDDLFYFAEQFSSNNEEYIKEFPHYAVYVVDESQFREAATLTLKDLRDLRDGRRTLELYVTLLNGSKRQYKEIRAQYLGNGLYKLLPSDDYDAAKELWEFPPGTIVKAVERRLWNKKDIYVAVDQDFIEKTTDVYVRLFKERWHMCYPAGLVLRRDAIDLGHGWYKFLPVKDDTDEYDDNGNRLFREFWDFQIVKAIPSKTDHGMKILLAVNENHTTVFEWLRHLGRRFFRN